MSNIVSQEALQISNDLRSKTEQLLELAKVQIIDQAGYDCATDCLKQIKEIIKGYDAECDEPIKAAFNFHKSLVAAKKKYTDPLTTAEQDIKRRAAAWITKQERIKREEQRRQLEEQQRQTELAKEFGLDEMSQEIATAPIEVQTVNKNGISYVEVWKFEVISPELVPREYLMVDEQKIGKLIRAMNGSINIPGVHIFSEKSVRVR